MMWTQVVNWLTLRDYVAAKEAATHRIVRKQSRGSISAQNGDIMHKKELDELSRRADEAVERLPKVAC